MRDDNDGEEKSQDHESKWGLRLEWYECTACGSPYTWFNIQVMEGVMMVGWVHQVQLWGRAGQCPKDRRMAMHDMRLGTFNTE